MRAFLRGTTRGPTTFGAFQSGRRFVHAKQTPRSVVGAAVIATISVGAVGAGIAFSEKKSMGAPNVVEKARKYYTMSQSDPDAKYIAKHLPWYGPDYSPHKVPSFYDVSGLTEDYLALKKVVDIFVARYRNAPDGGPTHVAGFDARGFIFGPLIAQGLGVPFVMIRKAGKLPGVLVSSGAYETEYSKDETVMRLGSVRKGDKVLLVDDLIATGGTALAGFDLCDSLGAQIYEFAAIIALPSCGGVEKIHTYKGGKFKDVPVFTMVDDATIGADQCQDPPRGTPRVVPANAAEALCEQLGL